MSLKKEIVKPEKIKPAPANPQRMGYQSGYNADGQAVNSGQVLANFEGNAFFSPTEGLTDDAQRGVADLNRGMTNNAQAQMGRQLESQNAQKNMADQATRSQLTQQGLANQAQIYGDINQRAVDQMGLAAKLQEATIRNNFAIANQQAMKIRSNMQNSFNLKGSQRVADNLMMHGLHLKGSLLS